MSINKAQILKQAQTYMAKGQLDKAIVEWEKLLSESPNDGNIYNTIGDLYLKKKDAGRSVESFMKAADVFHESGFDLKTIAVYKKILKINSKFHEVYRKLGDLNAERGLTGNAVADYMTLARKYIEDNKPQDAVEIYRKIITVDPQNVNSRLKLSELLLKEELKEQAIKEYLELSRVYVEKGSRKDAETVFRHILKIDPENAEAKAGLEGGVPQAGAAPSKAEPLEANAEVESEAAEPVEAAKEADPVQLAEAAYEAGRWDEALERYGKLSESDPANLGYSERLGLVHLKQGRPDEAYAVLEPAVRQTFEAGDSGEAVRLLKAYMAVDPDRLDAHLWLARAFEKQGENEKANAEYVHLIQGRLDSGETEEARRLYDHVKEREPDHPELAVFRPHFEAEAPVEAAVAEHEPSVGISPEPRPEPTPGLTDAEPAAVEEEEVSAAPVAEEPSSETMQSILESTIHSAEEASEAGASSRSGAGEMDPAALNDLFVEAEVYVKYGLVDKAIDQLKKVIEVAPDHVEAYDRLIDTLQQENRQSEAADACVSLAILLKSNGDLDGYRYRVEQARELDPENSRLKRQKDIEKVLEPDSMQDILDQEAEGEQAPAETGATAEPAAGAPSAGTEGESSFAGLWEEESQAASGGQEAPPAEEKVAAKSGGEDFNFEGQLEDSFAALAMEPTPVPEADREEISLEEELEQTFTSLMGSPSPAAAGTPAAEDTLSMGHAQSVASSSPSSSSSEELEHTMVSKYHEEDGSEKLSGEDIETHYNLGIAYSEMGLINDAITEFKIASRSTDRFVDAQSMLAACYRKKGKTAEAATALQRALSAPQCNEKEREWLTYELAGLYESENKLKEALGLYNEIYQKDPAFKDVGEKVEELRKRATGSPGSAKAKEAPRDKDEQEIDNLIDEFFDNSLSKDSQKESARDPKDEKKKKSRISYL